MPDDLKKHHHESMPFSGNALHELCERLRNEGIQSLTITGSELNDADAQTIATVFRETNSLIEINLSFNEMTSAGAIAIASICSLQKVILNNNLSIGHEGIAAFAQHPNVASLGLRCTDVTPDAISVLSQNNKILELNLSTNRCEVSVVEPLKGFKNLRSLKLSQTPGVDDHFVAELCQLKKMTSLEIFVTRITDKGAMSLLDNFSLVGSLNVSPYDKKNPSYNLAVYDPLFITLPMRNQYLWQSHLFDSAMACAQGILQPESRFYQLPSHVLVDILFYAIVKPNRGIYAEFASSPFILNCLDLIINNVIQQRKGPTIKGDTIKWWQSRRFPDAPFALFKKRDPESMAIYEAAMEQKARFYHALSASAAL